MRYVTWGNIIISSIVFCAALFLVGILQPSMPGRWCADGQQWQVCYRDWLTGLSGYIALLVGALSIAAIRNQIEASEKIARQGVIRDRAANIARYRAALEIALPIAEAIKAKGATLSELFIQSPQLLIAENDPEFSAIRPKIVEFNRCLGDYITLSGSSAARRLDQQGETPESAKLKEIQRLKDSIVAYIDSIVL